MRTGAGISVFSVLLGVVACSSTQNCVSNRGFERSNPVSTLNRHPVMSFVGWQKTLRLR